MVKPPEVAKLTQMMTCLLLNCLICAGSVGVLLYTKITSLFPNWTSNNFIEFKNKKLFSLLTRKFSVSLHLRNEFYMLPTAHATDWWHFLKILQFYQIFLTLSIKYWMSVLPSTKSLFPRPLQNNESKRGKTQDLSLCVSVWQLGEFLTYLTGRMETL